MLLITAARLIDGTGAPPLAPGAVLVDGDRIVAVGGRHAPGGAERIDLPGATILPGLIDLHVHLSDEGLPDASVHDDDPPEAWLARMAEHARRTLAAGVTTVRDVGGRYHAEFALRRRGGPLPRLVLAGRIVSAPTPGAASWRGMYREASGGDDLVRAVREQLLAGADVIKVMATGAVLAPGSERPDDAQLGEDELRAVVAAAHAAGRRVAAHAHGIEGIRRAVRAGADTVEHGTDLHRDPGVAREMAARGTFLVPTLKALGLIAGGAGVPEAMAAKARERLADRDATFRLALDAGVPIGMGTDAATPFNRHGENAQELALMVALGMRPLDAIVASTGAAARALGRDDVGVLAAGRLADLAVWDGDPLAGIRVLERPPRLVLLGGARAG
ncbi:MAG TPA: amidohydrolase family protein [Candidatus Limnocylindria bacterium]|nr:amidohydrolase family protein [Candidatus Limnocylindria bacterium]